MRKKIVNIVYKFKSSFLLRILFCLFNCKFKIGKKNRFESGRSVLINCNISISGVNNRIIFNDDSFLENCSIKIMGNNNTVVIGRNAYANDLNVIIEKDNNNISVGDNYFVCGKTRLYVVDGSELRFGDNCMLSDNIEIRTTDNHAIYDIVTGDRINYEKNIEFGNHVWIGMGVTVLKGVLVADGCVLGARSVITKSVNETNCCVVGNNHIVKRNVRWTMER